MSNQWEVGLKKHRDNRLDKSGGVPRQANAEIIREREEEMTDSKPSKAKKEHKKYLDENPVLEPCPACEARGQIETDGRFFIAACHKDDALKCLKAPFGKLCVGRWQHTRDQAVRKWNRRQSNFAGICQEREKKRSKPDDCA